MPENVYRLGFDPSESVKGFEDFKRAAKSAQEAAKDFDARARAVEQATTRLGDSATDQAARLRQAAEAERQYAREIEKRGREQAEAAAKTSRETATAAAAAFQQEFELQQAAIKLAQARGLLTPEEASKAGKDAAAAYNASVVSTIDRLSVKSTNKDEFLALAGSLKTVETNSGGAAVGLGRLGPSIASAARQAAGAHPVVGQLSYVLGGLALGTGTTIAVLGGLAAFAAAFRHLGEDARQTKADTEAAIDSLLEASQVRAFGAGGRAVGQVELGTAEVERLGAEISEAFEALNTRIRRGASESTVQAARDRIAGLQELYRDAVTAVEEGERQVEEATRREAKAAADRMQQVRSQIYGDRIDELRSNLQLMAAEYAANERALAAAAESFINKPVGSVKALAEALKAALDDMKSSAAGLDDVFGGRDIEAANASVERLLNTWREAPASVERALNILGAINRTLAETGKTADDLIPGLQAQINALRDILGDDLGDVGENGADQFEGAWKRAASSVGRELGGVAGILADLGTAAAAGGMAGLFSSAAGFAGRGLGELFGGTGGRDAEQRQLLEANNRALELVAENLEDFGARLANTSAEQVEAYRDFLAFARNDPSRAPGGFSSAQRARIYQDFGADPNDRSAETYERIQKLVEAALAEAFDQVQTRLIPDFMSRALDVAGNEVEAAAARRAAAAQVEILELQRLEKAGFITAAQLREFTGIIGGELTQALADAYQAAEEAARVIGEDLYTRGLAATGQGGAASLARLGFAQRRERLSLADSDPATLALLDAVQRAERISLEGEVARDRQSSAVRSALADQLAVMDAQLNVARDTLQAAEDQVRAYERSTAELRRLVDGLDAFAFDLTGGSGSPLSAYDRLEAAQAQFSALAELARGGDRTAAASVPGAGRALIDASQAYGRSGQITAGNYELVRSTVEALREQYAGALSIEQQALEAARQTAEGARTQISVLEQARADAQRDAERTIQAIEAGSQAELEALAELIELLAGDVLDKDAGGAFDAEDFTADLPKTSDVERIAEQAYDTSQELITAIQTNADATNKALAELANNVGAGDDRVVNELQRVSSNLGTLAQYIANVENAVRQNSTDVRTALEGARL